MLKIELDKPLDGLTSFHLASVAEAWAEADCIAALKEAFAAADEKGWSVTVIGGGTNVVPMSRVPGLLLHPDFRGLSTCENAEGRRFIVAGAAEPLDGVVRFACSKGYGGLENLAALPGSVGGAVVQNAGAYGVEIAERFAWARVWDPKTRETRTLDLTDCDFGYRSSFFKSEAGRSLIIIEAAFALPERWEPVIAYKELAARFAGADPASLTPSVIEAAVREIRRAKLPDPAETGSAGSFFKNPIVTKLKARELLTLHPALVSYPLAGGRAKLAAGWLIEAAGLRGMTEGNAGIWPGHALILINRGGATGEEVLRLAREIAARVERRFGVELEPEPIFLGASF